MCGCCREVDVLATHYKKAYQYTIAFIAFML